MPCRTADGCSRASPPERGIVAITLTAISPFACRPSPAYLGAMTNYDHDLFVIGAGSGGVRAARIASGHGARVAIAEEYRVGGTCVIRGCVPKKLLVYGSHFAEDLVDARRFGWTLGEQGLRLADAARQRARRGRPAQRHLPHDAVEPRRPPLRGARRAARRAHRSPPRARRPPSDRHRRQDPDRHRRAPARPRPAGGRARHHLERGVPPRRAAEVARRSPAAAISPTNSPASSTSSASR